MRPEDFEYFRRLARDLEKLQPSPEVQEALRHQAELSSSLFADPAVRRAHADAARWLAERNRLFAHQPDPATQRAIREAARYFNSPQFLSQRNAVQQAVEEARRHLGAEGLFAAGRVATRRSTSEGTAENAAERIEAGQATELLDEATNL